MSRNQSRCNSIVHRVLAAISRTCHNLLPKCMDTYLYISARHVLGGPARRTISRAGKTDSTAPIMGVFDSLEPPVSVLSSFNNKPGRDGYLSYDRRIERPSHPASVTDLLSVVPNNESIRLRNSKRPQFRMAQLIRSVHSHGRRATMTLHFRVETVSS